MISNKKETVIISIYCLMIALLVLLFTTKNSPLYPFNDWCDANAFFTVGKGIFNGKVPYKDLFEQKGPLLYLIYGIGYLISHRTFLGVFIIEVIIFGGGLYYLFKTLRLFLSKKSAIIILPIFSSILCTCKSFVHGGSAEELTILCFFITLYYFFKHFKLKELNTKEMLFNGIVAGMILLIKYTLLGFWIAFTLSIFIDFMMKKKYKDAIVYPLYLLLGMVIPFTIALIYFLINGGVKAFINNYFIVNITAYSTKTYGIIDKIQKLVAGFIGTLSKNVIMIPLFISIIIFIPFLKLPTRAKWLLLLIIMVTIFGVFYGLKFYPYYLLFILFFSSIAYLVIFSIVDKYIVKLSRFTYLLILSIVMLGSLANSYYNANYKQYRFVKKSDLYQYELADIINSYPNPSLVNMGHLDCGLYTTTGLVPTTYFFQRHNIPYANFKDNLDEFANYIKNKTTTHIIYHTRMDEDELQKKEPLLFENYQLIAKAYHKYEGKPFIAYLFQIKL